jgi:hypothetical protein
MPISAWATIHNGQIVLSEGIELPEGAKVLVTVLPDDEDAFWQGASESSLADVWDNAEDDVYAQLLDQ